MYFLEVNIGLKLHGINLGLPSALWLFYPT